MEPKEVKSLLKSAREAIRKKEFKDALKSCKSILKEDKENYNALVFVGVAADGLDQTDQSIAAYKKAISVDDKQQLAWQGLCSLYEKSSVPDHQKELVHVYQTLIDLFHCDPKKKTETQHKLFELLCSHNMTREALTVITDLCGKEETVEETLVDKILSLINKSTTHQLNQAHIDLINKCFLQFLQKHNQCSEDALNKSDGYLFAICYKSSSAKHLHQMCLEILNQWPDDIRVHRIVAELFLISQIDSSLVLVDVKNSETELERNEPEGALIKFIHGAQKLQDQNLIDAKNLFLQGLEMCGQDLFPWLLLSDVYTRMHDPGAAEKCLQKVSGMLDVNDIPKFGVSKKIIEMRVEVLKVKGLLEQNDPVAWKTALEAIKKLQIPDHEICVLQAEALIKLEDFNTALELISRLPDSNKQKTLHGEIMFHLNRTQEADKLFSEVLQSDPKNTRALFRKATLLMQENVAENSARSHSYLLQCVKSDPFFSPGFLHLGHHYKKLGDMARAEKCYRKAYQLDPLCDEAGVGLVDVLTSHQQQEEAYGVLQQATGRSGPGTGKWAWLRLGLHQLRSNEPQAAIISLQAALRTDSEDPHCWECLGEAYLSRGSYVAALRAFTKVTEFSDSPLYSLYQIATIKLTLGQYTEAISDFKLLLEKNSDYVPALKGLGEAHLQQAKSALRTYLHGRAVEMIQLAVEYLTRAVTKQPRFSCLWKLLGDSCTLIYHLPDDLATIQVPKMLLEKDASESEHRTTDKLTFMSLGARCYGMAIKSQPECAALWQDLGINYFFQTQYNHGTNPATANTLAGRAFHALENAAKLQPGEHTHWTALGLLCAHPAFNDKALAQHCFIKSLEVEANNPWAWGSLGTLYLNEGKVELAHSAFKTAQSLDPTYVTAWIGQAIIAERVGEEAEAIDLFRHTTEIECKPEGARGYAHWVCTILMDPKRRNIAWNKYILEHMDAVASAAEVMEKYTGRFPTDATALNMKGILFEQQNLLRGAMQAYDQAAKLISSQNESLSHQIQLNLARVQSKRERDSSSSLTINMDLVTSFNELCNLAIISYNRGDYANAFELYDKAQHLASSPGDLSHVFTARGMVKYTEAKTNRQPVDLDVVKTEFFKCVQNKPVSAQGLTALLALALIEQDVTLASAALDELSTSSLYTTAAHHHAFLVACTHALKDEVDLGKRELVRLLHKHPNHMASWAYLVQYLLDHNQLAHAAKCAIIGLQQPGDAAAIKNLKSWLPLAQLGEGHHSGKDPVNNAHSSALKAVLMYPDDLENWLALAATLYAQVIITGSLEKAHSLSAFLPKLMAKVESQLSQKQGNLARLNGLHLWCVKLHVLSLLILGKTEQATQFMQQAMWLYDSDLALKQLLAFTEGDLAALKKTCRQGHLPRSLFVQLCLKSGSLEPGRRELETWIKNTKKSPAKQSLQIKMAQICSLALVKEPDSIWYETSFKESTEEVLKRNPSNPAVNMILALTALNKRNFKKAKKHCLVSLEGYGNDQHGFISKVLAFTYVKLGDKQALETMKTTAEEQEKRSLLGYLQTLNVDQLNEQKQKPEPSVCPDPFEDC